MSSHEPSQNQKTADNAQMTAAQRARIERQRQRARALRDARLPCGAVAAAGAAAAAAATSLARDSGGGFLLDDDPPTAAPISIRAAPAPVVDERERPACLECGLRFAQSHLFDEFSHPVCDACERDSECGELVTRTEAKSEYLLKDCDLDSRPPALRCVRRRNPHRARFAEMRLYLRAQVEARALEVWGSAEALAAERARREERQQSARQQRERRRLLELRLSVRSSLYDGRAARDHHHHEFDDERYDAAEDLYSRTCRTCGHTETYEKM